MTNERLFLSPPHMGGTELEYIKQAFESNYIAPTGPLLTKFEAVFSEYLDIPHCVALSSGTAAMHLILRHLGIGPGDTVYASTLTFIGSVSPITFQGASPVFIDCDRTSWNMDPYLLEEALADAHRTGRPPKAVIPTDLYGQCADLDAIKGVCEPYGIPVIVDAAESLGAEYKGRKSGKGADASIYSFNGNKIITTSGGGMLATDDKELADHARHLATQARDSAPYYLHTEVGFNYRMSNVVAGIGLGQMEVLDKRVQRRREIFAKYQELLSAVPGISFMPEAQYDTTPGGGATSRHNRWLTVILLDSKEYGLSPEELRLSLEEENIESRPVWNPMHRQPVFKECKLYGGSVSEDLFERGLCLPSGTAMTDNDIRRVAELVRQAAH